MFVYVMFFRVHGSQMHQQGYEKEVQKQEDGEIQAHNVAEVDEYTQHLEQELAKEIASDNELEENEVLVEPEEEHIPEDVDMDNQEDVISYLLHNREQVEQEQEEVVNEKTQEVAVQENR